MKLRPDRKETRRLEAEARQEAYDSLSVTQRLQNLDNLFGFGQGAARERARLMAQLSEDELAAYTGE